MKLSPYGTWESPLSAADIARSAMTMDITNSAISLSYVQVAGGTPYWIESRREHGRSVVATVGKGGDVRELTPASFKVRARAYGASLGRPYVVSDAAIYFSNSSDQRLYMQRGDAAPTPLTPEAYRYTDCEADSTSSRLFCVREDYTGSGEPRSAIVALDTAGADAGTVLFDGSDFVAYPRVSHDGRRIAWIGWNLPDLPWDSTTLYAADLTSSGLANVAAIAGGPRESVVEPRWDADGALYFISDRSNWWNLYRYENQAVAPVFTIDADLAGPLWLLGQSNYTLTGDGRAVVRYGVNGRDKLGVVGLRSGRLETLDQPFVVLSSIELLSSDTAVAIGASPVTDPAIVAIDLETGHHRVLRAPSELKLDASFISVAEQVEFPTNNGLTAHAFYYPPKNPDYAAPKDEKPPVVVKVHQGPTAQSWSGLTMTTQYWTTRGFAVLDVNFGGSTGFGRRYRERLNGNWGIVDAADTVAALNYLVAEGRVDGKRAAIRGASAAAFTVLVVLSRHDAVTAGASYSGLWDLETALRPDWIRFAKRYIDSILAPLPEGRAICRERSPVNHLDGIKAPLIIFHGAQDIDVPVSQVRAVVAALQRRGATVAYMEFEDEGHSLAKPQNVTRALEAELAFYGQTFGFVPAGSPQPLKRD